MTPSGPACAENRAGSALWKMNSRGGQVWQDGWVSVQDQGPMWVRESNLESRSASDSRQVRECPSDLGVNSLPRDSVKKLI